MGSAMAGDLAVLPVEIAAGMTSVMLAVTSLGSVVTLVWSLSAGLSPSSQLAECCEMVGAATFIALLSICWALGRGMGIAKFVAVSMG